MMEAVIIAVVEVVIQNLRRCLKEETVVLWEEAERLECELKRMQWFLKRGEGKCKGRCWVERFLEVAYEAEDVIRDLMFESLSGRFSLFPSFKRLIARFTAARELARLTGRIRDLNGAAGLPSDEEMVVESESKSYKKTIDFWMAKRESDSPLIEEFFVGREQEKEELVLLLTNENVENHRVIGICGMGGIGKTTLANKIYQDCRVQRSFEGSAWVIVPRGSRPIRKVLEHVLMQLNVAEGEAELMPFLDLQLAQKVFESLLDRRYLIVLDDIWDTDLWECLQLAFPLERTSSRFLITTRCGNLGDSIQGKGMVHHMNLLSQEGSCELLLKTASRGYSHSRDYEVDEELHQIAMKIVRRCQGMPLAIAVIGGLLAANQTAWEWRMVLQGLDSYLNPGRSSKGAINLNLYPNKDKGSQEIAKTSAIFSLSYDALPNHLKPCFLCVGAFSEDREIKANRLISHWLAEGMISSGDRESNTTLEDIAEGFLYELAIRNLVLVKEKEVPTTRRFKSCHLHDLVRELCLSKLKEEKFFDVTCFERAKHSNLGSYPPFGLALYLKDGCVFPHNSSTDKYLLPLSFFNMCKYQQEFTSPVRVLNLIGTNFKVLRSQPPIVQLRTLQFLSLRDLPQASSDLRCFRRLRVLDINCFDFNKTRFPKGIEMLSRLRFLSLENCNITQLPSSICSLANLEALYLRKCPGIIIPNELQKLRRLKYLHLPRSFRVPGVDKLQLEELRELQSLKNFDSRVCKVKDLLKLTKLRKLVARTEENFEDLVEIIKCIKNLRYLRHCSLVVRGFDHNLREEDSVAFNLLFASPNLHVLHIHGHLDNLPLNISQSLTKISFSGSELNEDPMAKLEKLPHLWFLALSNSAFLGKHISCSASGMPRLKCLTLSNLQNLENLTVQKGAMPKLSTLAIESCQKLVQLPEGLCSLTSLQRLMVTWMPPAFIDRIHEGAEDFHKVKHVPFIRIRSWPSQTTKSMPSAFQMSCWKLEKIFEN